MEIKNKLAVIAGAILVIIATVMLLHVVQPVVDTEVSFAPVKYDAPVFVPADSAHDFAFNDGKYTCNGTAIYTVCNTTVYGTLYVADNGRWIIVDPCGHIAAGGSRFSPVPVVKEGQ